MLTKTDRICIDKSLAFPWELTGAPSTSAPSQIKQAITCLPHVTYSSANTIKLLGLTAASLILTTLL